jgi:hypothetical protein
MFFRADLLLASASMSVTPPCYSRAPEKQMPGHALPGLKNVRKARNSLSERNEKWAKICRFKSLR